MKKAKEQDKYKYRPRNWRRLSLPRIEVLRLEWELRSLEEIGLMEYVNGQWYEREFALGELYEELYREGKLVKALDDSGEPLLREGYQVYKTIEYATSAERAFWNKENKSS
jgi:hypothetical protein